VSLDLSKVAAQIGEMVARLRAGSRERQRRLDYALNVLHEKAAALDALKKKVAASRTTWLVAGLVEGLDRKYKAAPLPAEFTVLATDGSHIDVDRHRSARCYLINIGTVLLRYGASPGAVLDSFPRLYAGDEDLVIAPAESKGREQPIEGNLLGIKRSVDECRRLAGMAAEVGPDCPALALLDGSLVLWGLEAYPEFVTGELLTGGFLSCLDDIRKLNGSRKIALASYISYPRSADVVNVLRVALCPQEPLDTDRHCRECTQRSCDEVSGVVDRELFAGVLEPGERSALFTSQSSVVRKYYGEHWINFFYLNVGDEIARVEIPQWVARDEYLLGLTHTLVFDQCQRGQGYPVALSEAHEQAVVTMVDRESFWQVVDSSLVEEHLPTPTSAKSQSKRTRWV